MRDTLFESLRTLRWTRRRKSRISVTLLLLSLVVMLDVFWILRQPGLTQAGDAACGILEHTHDDACVTQLLLCELSEEDHIHEDACYTWDILCDFEEHIHSISCYSDEAADVETPLDWQEMFEDYPYGGDLRQDLVAIAETQVGYSESTRNFEVDSDGERHGYTRYGAWYGAPYRDWSAMFVSFCLHYAGADPEVNPGNTGADSMAAIWDTLGKYAPSGEYLPSDGDLVFFADNTVGIVTMVHNATFYVIRGDVDDTVSGTVMSLDDPAIIGWGLMERTVPVEDEIIMVEAPELLPEVFDEEEIIVLEESELYPEVLYEEEIIVAEALELLPEVFDEEEIIILEESELDEEELLDISEGPAFFIFADGGTELQMQRFNLRNVQRTSVDLKQYLAANGGMYFFTLLDTNNQELPKDEQENYIVTAGTSYKLTLSINSPNGILPGTYQYALPDGLTVNGGTGSFILEDGTYVGDWTVTDTGLITMAFNENMNSRTDITISATMGIQFEEREENLNFDGKITVTVEKPPQQELITQLSKYGKQGNENNDKMPDPTKLYWTVSITGKEDSRIPGSLMTDQIVDSDHRYTESDRAAGLRVGVSERDPVTGVELQWHHWTVPADDPALIWNDDGWSYTIPEFCEHCGETLGNDGWVYYIEYTSTPERTSVGGTLEYENLVMVDGQQAYGWGSFVHGETLADVIKTGSFRGDAEGGAFYWEFQVTIPGMKMGQKADYYWYLMDNMQVTDAAGNRVGYIQNDADLATVTATNNGRTFTVPNVKYATADDRIAWMNAWSNTDNNGVPFGREIHLLYRCDCTEETCSDWYGSCGGRVWYESANGLSYDNYCHCWCVEGDTTFTFTYKTEDLSVVETYGGLGNKLHNEVLLYNKVKQPNGEWGSVKVDDSVVSVPIPGLFKKELTRDFDGYTAHYRITVNESKLVLTGGSPLKIHDEMTETLAYISGSLVITTEDTDGNTGVLQQGVDYTVTYDGTGNEKDEDGNPVHVLDIEILHPQPVMYILDYDTTLIIPAGATEAVKYSNAAVITLWGEDIKNGGEEKVYADINIAAKSYRVDVHKKDSLTGDPLAGATFGLFNAQGGQITSAVTDADGKIVFQTNIIQGIILREHVLYYIQELDAPAGYRMDDTKYWFCFCNNMWDSCETCDEIMKEIEAFRIPFEQIGTVQAVNELLSYELPETGGSGIYPFVQVGAVFILTPLVYRFIQRRRQERRGAG